MKPPQSTYIVKPKPGGNSDPCALAQFLDQISELDLMPNHLNLIRQLFVQGITAVFVWDDPWHASPGSGMDEVVLNIGRSKEVEGED